VPAGKSSAGGGGSSVGLGLGFAARGVDEGGVEDWGSGSGGLGGADSEGWGLGGRVAGEEAESAMEEENEFGDLFVRVKIDLWVFVFLSACPKKRCNIIHRVSLLD